MNIPELREFAENTPLVVHNAKFEHQWLLHHNIDGKIVDDTMLLAYVYDSTLPLDLESLVLKFNIDKPFKEEHGTDVAELEGERLRVRNATDARNTLNLRNVLKPKLTPEELRVYEGVLLPAAKSLAKIELEGIRVDSTKVAELQEELDNKIIDVRLGSDPMVKEFKECTNNDFNINSNVHRGIMVYDLLGYEPLPFKQAQTDDGAPSTQLKVLKALNKIKETTTLSKIIESSSLNGYKKWYANLTNECDKCERPHILPVDDKEYIFPSLHLGFTSTGRISSSHPNMQNSPSREGGWCRKVFIPKHDEGCIMEWDYDQIELRILAGISGDERLLEEFDSGLDPHIEMAKIAFNKKDADDTDRFFGKTLNYAIPFGRGADGIAFDTGRDVKEARQWLKRYWKAHPQLKEYLSNIPQEGIVVSPTGMKRYCPSWTTAKNFGIQNTALITLLMALNNTVDEAKRINAPIDLCIHDSVRQDVTNKKDVKSIYPVMKELLEFKAGEAFGWLPIPLTVGCKVGNNWGEMEKYEG